MIFMHEGIPGSGKSYDVIRRIISVLLTGRKVYTNVDGLDNEHCRLAIADIVGITVDELNLLLIFLTPSQVGEFWEHCDDNSFIVIDEVHKVFNARDWNKAGNREFANWASTHRHHGIDVALITQNANKVEGQVRSLIEWRYYYRKMNMFGSMFKNGYLVYSYTSDDTKPLNMRKCTYDKRIFKCYKSYQGNSMEKSVVKNANILNHPLFYGMAVVLFAFIYAFNHSSLKDGDILGAKAAQARIVQSMNTIKTSAGDLTSQSGDPQLPGAVASPSVQVAAVDTPSEFQWLPVSAYIKKANREYVMVGSYRLDTFIRMSADLKLVLVDTRTCPDTIIRSVSFSPPI